jgi:hypothetical protein
VKTAAHIYFRRDTNWLQDTGSSVSVRCVLPNFPDTFGVEAEEAAVSIDWLTRAERLYRATNPLADVEFVG